MIVEVDIDDLKRAIAATLVHQLNTIKVDGFAVDLAWVDHDGRRYALAPSQYDRVVANVATNVAQMVALGELGDCATCDGSGVGLNGPCTSCRGHGDTRGQAVRINTEASSG